MLPNCFTCPHKVVQYREHLHNSQNQEMELFSGTKNLPNLEACRGIEGVQYVHSNYCWTQPTQTTHTQTSYISQFKQSNNTNVSYMYNNKKNRETKNITSSIVLDAPRATPYLSVSIQCIFENHLLQIWVGANKLISNQKEMLFVNFFICKWKM